MKPQTIGRVLGIGVRVAGRFVGQQIAGEAGRAAGAGQAVVGPRPAGSATVSGAATRMKAQDAARATVQASRGVKQGVGGFLRPFKRVGGILWLEVTGVFFLLFALVFGMFVWKSWAVHAQPGGFRNMAIAAVFLVLFLYLGISSFWRANRK